MYIDINWEARTNGEFRHKLDSLIGEIEKLEKRNTPVALEQAKQRVIDVYRLCHYNPGFLIPYFFPKFHPTVPKPTPLSLQSRPYAFAAFYFQIGGFIVFRSSRQIGKALEAYEPVKTPTGWLPIGALCPGDTVYDGNHQETRVQNVFRQGVVPIYKILFSDGTHSLCCMDHLWVCRVGLSVTPVVLTLRDMLPYVHVEDTPLHVPKCTYDVETNTTKHTHVQVESVNYFGEHEAVCIVVESPEATFITRDGIVTHNSTSLGTRQLLNAHIIRKYRSLYVTPHQEFLNTYANRLRDLEREFRFSKTNPRLRNNLKYKEFDNGSTITLVKCLMDSAEARSKTTDELLYDEYQLLDPELEPDIEQTQKASSMPSTIYAGTSTTIESPLECRFQESSMGFWHIKCPDDKHWINCGDVEDINKIIMPEGPTCPHTGRPLDVRNGTFVHTNQQAMYDNQIGFHIPQLIIPEYAHDILQWKKIYRAYKKYDFKKFSQEILGIPTEEGSREITLQHLKDICVLPEHPETLAKKAKASYYRYVISGCDWGGSDYNPAERTKVSFTVHVILGITQDWKIHILHMRRFSGMDYREISHYIAEDHKRYMGNAIGADFGVGGAYNMLIRESGCVNVKRHLIFQYTGPNAAPLAQPSNSALFNHWMLNRTESITELFRAIRDQDILCFPYDEAKDYLLDLLNMYRIPSDSVGGGAGFLYRRHGAKADDTLHALNFAYVIARLYRKEPIMRDRQLEMTIHRNLGGGGGQGDQGFGGIRGGLIKG